PICVRDGFGGSFEPTFHHKRIATPRGVHASARGSLKRGLCSGSTCFEQVHPTSPHGKAGPFLFIYGHELTTWPPGQVSLIATGIPMDSTATILTVLVAAVGLFA